MISAMDYHVDSFGLIPVKTYKIQSCDSVPFHSVLVLQNISSTQFNKETIHCTTSCLALYWWCAVSFTCEHVQL